ncbi:Networked 3A [Hibiscus trionum]|uniref:Networked 3A n=1 Tax=Hibiscus trionum TaxID=183268 RepID=A0A9W7MPP9_HIBTR|nr:Networked 3A [Hibiscus trionum]
MECINDLDMKVNAILSIIVQDDGDSFAKRAEMYYQKRPQLIEMVEDLHKTYRSLAEKYDQLRSQLHSASPVAVTRVHGLQSCVELEGNGSVQDRDLEAELDDGVSNVVIKNSEMKPEDRRYEEEKKSGIGFERNTSNGYEAAMLEHEKLWNELRLKVSELVEDNLSHQAELIRRNDAKRETIRDLCSKMNMVDDNGNHKVTNKTRSQSQSQVSRLKRIFLGRFMK